MTPPRETEQPLDLGGVPPEEDVETADASDRVEKDPTEQPNYTEQHPDAVERTVSDDCLVAGDPSLAHRHAGKTAASVTGRRGGGVMQRREVGKGKSPFGSAPLGRRGQVA